MPGPASVLRLVVLPTQDGDRLDRVLAAATDLSRRRARTLVSSGLVSRNGAVIKVQGRTVACGDVLEVHAREVHRAEGQPRPEPVRILFEDSRIVAAHKPAGVLSQTSAGQDPAELALDLRLLLHLAMRDGRPPELRLLHRLDRVTSGVILFARDRRVLPRLTRAWAAGLVQRTYLAWIEGVPGFDRTVVDAPISRDRSHQWRFQVADSGRAARTEVRVVLRREPDLALVRCRLDTGRTHQVRVHLAALGHPVLGDRLYGSRLADRVPRPMLHAASLSLPHPGEERLRIASPLPPEFRIPLR